ncbi:MAG: hypothetical protein WAT39_25345 [Planctomycetota bacterium]
MNLTIHRGPFRPLPSFLAVAAACTFAAALAPLPAQTCWGQGSVPVAASIEPGPLLLGCAASPGWPQWHLFTPAHRAPAPHPGFNPGDATARSRLLVAYRCTGFLLVPVVPVRITVMGYVLDRDEIACPVTS